MIELRDMTGNDFEKFLNMAIPAYATSNVTARRWVEKDAMERSRQAFAELLPQGLATPHHLFFVIARGDDQAKVGYVWVKLEPDAQSAFLYQIDVIAEYQGRGYGTQAIRNLEALLKSKGVQKLALHVFGFNEKAIRLYERLGFEVGSLNMHKPL